MGQAIIDKSEHLREKLSADPGQVLEDLAREHGMSLLEVTQCLPADWVRYAPGEAFEEVMRAISTWGDVCLVVHTPDVILEFRGAVPPGRVARGFYNLHGNSPLGGHLRIGRCATIGFVTRPFMGHPTASVQFFNARGDAMFKVFLGRDSRGLRVEQMSAFDDLTRALT